MHYYQFNIADFNLHTSHLTLEEEAIYRRLLDYYYDIEGPIQQETKSVFRRLRLSKYSETATAILDEFFELRDGYYHNSRADKEISRYQKRVQVAKNNGKKGGRPKEPKENQVGLQKKTNQEPITNNQEPIKSIGAKKFAPPSLQEVTSYCRERQNTVDPQKFIDFYQGKGWMVGKNKMKDWKACVRTWENRDAKSQQIGGQRKLSVAERATEHRKRAERIWAEQEANQQSMGADDPHIRPPLDGDFRRDGD